MKALISTAIAITIIGSVSGCAVDPTQAQAMSQHFDPIEVHQMGDLALSCDDLSANIAHLSTDISTLNKQVASHQQASTGFSLLSTLSSVAGTYAPTFRAAQLDSAEGTVANAGASLAAGQAQSTTNLLAMYQGRHDALMQVYYGKNCK